MNYYNNSEYLIMQFWHVRKIYMHIHIHTYISISYVTGIFSALVYITVNVSWFISDVAFPDGIAGGYLFLGNMVYTVSCYWLYSDIVIDKSWCNTLMMTPWCCDTFVSYHHGMVVWQQGVTPPYHGGVTPWCHTTMVWWCDPLCHITMVWLVWHLGDVC